MKIVTQYQTIDGKIHSTKEAAKKHLLQVVENRLGKIVDQLRHKKALDVWEILNANLPEFAELYAMSEDAKNVENEDEFDF